MDNIYLHGVSAFYYQYSQKVFFEQLEYILQTGAVLSRRLQENSYAMNIGFNGLDYISLCDYDLKDTKIINPKTGDYHHTSYHSYIEKTVSLMFNKDDIPVIKPKLVSSVDLRKNKDFKRMERLGKKKNKRYSDMPDEVQVKDIIPLKYLSGITIPCNFILEKQLSINEKRRILSYQLRLIKKLLTKYSYNIPIYDLDTFNVLMVDDDIDSLLLKK